MAIVQHDLFAGKVCTGCGIWWCLDEYDRNGKTRDGRGSRCKQCLKAYRRTRSAEAVEYVRQWRKNHPGYTKGRRRGTPRTRLSPEQAKEKQRLRNQARYQKDKDARRIRAREYFRLHPEYSAITSLRYNARKKGAQGSYTPQEWRDLCALYDHRCLCCGKEEKLTADHVVPLSRGGDNTISNIQPLCQPCNSSKGVQTIDYRPKVV